jgi:hypothetical protein
VAKMKIDKPHMNTRVVNEKATTFIVPNINITTMAINNHRLSFKYRSIEIQLMMFSWMGDLG